MQVFLCILLSIHLFKIWKTMKNTFSEIALLLLLIYLFIICVYEFTVVKIRCNNNGDDNCYYHSINGLHLTSVLFISLVFPNQIYSMHTD